MGVYEHIVRNAPPPWEFVRWSIAEKFGWRLKDVDELSLDDYRQYLDITAGYSMAYRRGLEKKHGDKTR